LGLIEGRDRIQLAKGGELVGHLYRFFSDLLSDWPSESKFAIVSLFVSPNTFLQPKAVSHGKWLK